MPWGDPDLQGIWDFRTITPMERPAELVGAVSLALVGGENDAC